MHHKARQIGLWGVVLILGAGLVWLGRVASPTPLADIPPAPRPGAPAPDFELMTLGGEPVSLAELRGQAVVINLWATWCPPCRAEMPAMQRVYEDYRDE
ncbi:MAG: TlpA disulfide reductase family protein, partial [Anaerolineales bacterium]